MNLKLRVALFFTLFVAAILVVSSVVIYVVTYNFRESDYYSRLNLEADVLYTEFMASKTEKFIYNYVNNPKSNGLINQHIVIYDAKQKVLFKYPDTIQVNLTSKRFETAKKKELLKLREDFRESILAYYPETDNYIYVSAFDKYGIRKTKNVRIILFFVTIIGTILTALMSFFVVKKAIQPLRELSDEIAETTEQNLDKKLQYNQAKDEIFQIANSYNLMLDRLKKSFDLQRSFVHHASHELRTPLATMLLETENALAKNYTQAQLQQVLVSLKEEQEEIIQLTNSLLLLSQYENMQSYNLSEVVRIDEVLYSCIQDAYKSFNNMNVSVDFMRIPNENSLLIEGSETLLKSLFRNLLKNAYNYSDNKTVNVQLDADEQFTYITFSNNGILLKKEEIEMLFIPFFRATNSNNKKGHGLGLSIVKRVIDIYGGSIQYNTDNALNNFVVQLPHK